MGTEFIERVSPVFFISLVALVLFKTFDPENFKRLQIFLHDKFGLSIVGNDGHSLTADEIADHFRDPPAKDKLAIPNEVQGSSQKRDLSFLSDDQLWRIIAQKYLPFQDQL